MSNPFSLSFGKKPVEEIARPVQTAEILDAFLAEPINQQIELITGVRGAGKTVLLTDIASTLRNEDDWIVCELNPASDLLQGLVAKLARNSMFSEMLKTAKLSISVPGVSVELGGRLPVADLETDLAEMLTVLKKRGKRLLVTVDEVTNTESMKIFVSAFQILIREELPIFLLMTGLYENIEDLQNEKSLTFLYRAPKITLSPLNMNAVASRYRSLFHLDQLEAARMARLTKGYPFAFQALGYLAWEREGNYTAALPEYRQYLEEFVYDKIWSELSAKDRQLAMAIAESETGKVSDLMERAHFSQQEFSPYRKRMMRKGIVDTGERGVLRFALPLFDEYVRDQFLL